MPTIHTLPNFKPDPAPAVSGLNSMSADPVTTKILSKATLIGNHFTNVESSTEYYTSYKPDFSFSYTYLNLGFGSTHHHHHYESYEDKQKNNQQARRVVVAIVTLVAAVVVGIFLSKNLKEQDLCKNNLNAIQAEDQQIAPFIDIQASKYNRLNNVLSAETSLFLKIQEEAKFGIITKCVLVGGLGIACVGATFAASGELMAAGVSIALMTVAVIGIKKIYTSLSTEESVYDLGIKLLNAVAAAKAPLPPIVQPQVIYSYTIPLYSEPGQYPTSHLPPAYTPPPSQKYQGKVHGVEGVASPLSPDQPIYNYNYQTVHYSTNPFIQPSAPPPPEE